MMRRLLLIINALHVLSVAEAQLQVAGRRRRRDAHDDSDLDLESELDPDHPDLPSCKENEHVLSRSCRLHSLVTLPEGYDINEVPPPPVEGGAIVVNFSVNLNNILAIDEPKQVSSLAYTTNACPVPDVQYRTLR